MSLGERRRRGGERRADAHEGLLADHVAAVDGLADRGLDDLELGPGLGDRPDAVALDDESRSAASVPAR